MHNTILQGDALETLRTLPDSCVQSCITSPPYFGLRDYGINGQIGLEETPEHYTEKLVQVFREVRRVLCSDGVLWLNLGDSYVANKTGSIGATHSERMSIGTLNAASNRPDKRVEGLKPKNLLGIPWRVAFVLQADGWILRSDVIWHKTNAMPESVKDRPTKAHEYLFLFAKSERYYYNSDNIRECIQFSAGWNKSHKDKKSPNGEGSGELAQKYRFGDSENGKNKRSVWSIATQPYKGAHFAVMPQKLVEPCVLASSRHDDIILDPFSGAGTVALVALKHGRRYIGIELNPEYIKLAQERLTGVQLPLVERQEENERWA